MKQTITYCDSCKKMILGEVHTMIPCYRKGKVKVGWTDIYAEEYFMCHNKYQDLCDECFEKRKAKVIEIISNIGIDESLLRLTEAWILDNRNEEIGKIIDLQKKEESP